jgi:hypothetical protein
MPDRRPSFPVADWLVLVLAAITAHVAWQYAPLTARMDALERDQLAAKDDLQAEIERLSRQLANLERTNPPSTVSRVVRPSETPAAVPPKGGAPQSPSQPAGVAPSSSGLEFLDRHLLPSDATIARMMVGKAAPADIAHATNHSVVFVLARGRQIEEMLTAAHDAPPDLLRAIRDYLGENLPSR